MLLDLEGPPANPSSPHALGRHARKLLDEARCNVAQFFNARPDEIIFTSGATEGINHFLKNLTPKGHVITTGIEHSSVYRTLQMLEKEGLKVTYLPVGLGGAPKPCDIEEAIQIDTKAIIMSAANSETGVKIDFDAVGKIAQSKGILFFLDCVGLIGKEPFSLPPGVSSFVIGAHKFHGPKGIGLLFRRKGVKLDPLFLGGNQESMQRAGTVNLAGILGMSEALSILRQSQKDITKHIRSLRDEFEQGLLRNLSDIVIHGQGERISNTSNIAFLGVDGESLYMQLDRAGIYASYGSACASGAREPSRVLLNMGIDRKVAMCSIRFSLGRMNTEDEIKEAVERITKIVADQRW